MILPQRGVTLIHPFPQGICLGLSCCWPFFLHFVLKASKLERRPCYPFVQADMLSACMEYEDILSDKQRGAHPSPPQGREPDTHPQPLPKGGGQGTSTYTSNRLTSNRRHPPSLGEGLGVGPRLRRITYPPEPIPLLSPFLCLNFPNHP